MALTGFEGAGDGDQAEAAACEHLEDRSDDRRLLLIDDERGRCGSGLLHVVVSIDVALRWLGGAVGMEVVEKLAFCR